MQAEGRILHKSELDNFLKSLSRYGEIYAPVKTDTVRFQKIKSSSGICFEEHAWFPPKEFFFPQKHTLFKFKKGKLAGEKEKIQPAVLFGLRNCDLNAFLINDKLFLEQEHVDMQYKKRRENLLLVGLYCFREMDEYCFCSSMELQEYFDIMLIDKGSYYHVKYGSEKGKRFTDSLPESEEHIPTPTICTRELRDKNIRHLFEDSMWEEGADQCLSCGRCTNA